MRSVRARTTLAASVVVGVALLLAGIGLLGVQRRGLIRHVDEVIDLRADDLAALGEQSALPRTLIDAGDDEQVVEIVDRRGDVVATTRRRVELAVFTPTGRDAILRTVGHYRVAARTVRLVDGRTAWIFVGGDLQPVEEATGYLRVAILVVGPLLLALVALITWIVVGRALHPVDELCAEVADIRSAGDDRRVAVPATDDEISRLAVTMNDMLARMNADATIRRRFAADASHELRSPLASLRTGLEVALSDAEGSSWVAAATDALDTTSAMERLVQDLLFLARTDDPTAPRVVRSFDLDDVVLEEVARAGPRTPVDTSSVSAAEIIGRRDDIARVVRNLLDNALRHARSMVAVEVHGDEHGARLTVRDDGDGIAMEERDRIFERFTRLDDARSRHGGGAGLGLAIVREIVDAHGGSVRVEDAAPGARFVVDLPSV